MAGWIEKPYLGIGDLDMALADPLAWKQHILQVDVDILRAKIEILETTIAKAQEQIATARTKLEEAEARQQRHAELLATLKRGEKPPKDLLPTKEDIKREARRAVAIRKDLEKDKTDYVGEVDQWAFGRPTYGTSNITISARRCYNLTDKELAKILKIVGMPDTKAVPESIEIRTSGRVEATFTAPFERPDLTSKNAIDSAVASIDSWATKWEQGEIAPGKTPDAVVDYYKKMDALRPAEVIALNGLGKRLQMGRDAAGTLQMIESPDGFDKHMRSLLFHNTS